MAAPKLELTPATIGGMARKVHAAVLLSGRVLCGCRAHQVRAAGADVTCQRCLECLRAIGRTDCKPHAKTR